MTVCITYHSASASLVFLPSPLCDLCVLRGEKCGIGVPAARRVGEAQRNPAPPLAVRIEKALPFRACFERSRVMGVDHLSVVFMPLVPQGRNGNSPGIYAWVGDDLTTCLSPVGTIERRLLPGAPGSLQDLKSSAAGYPRDESRGYSSRRAGTSRRPVRRRWVTSVGRLSDCAQTCAQTGATYPTERKSMSVE